MMKLSNSSMSAWRRCRLQFYLKYVGNYLSPSSKAQRRGGCFHAGVAEWYTSGKEEASIDAAFQKLQEHQTENDRDYSDEWELIEYVLRRYIAWSWDNDDFSIVTVNGKPAIELRVDVNLGGFPVMGIIDGIVEYKGKNWILEHKLVDQVRTQTVDLDWQVSLYMLMAHKLGFNPAGVFYNVVRATKGGIAEKQPVVRMPTYRNVEGLAVIEQEVISQAEEIHKFLAEGGKVYRNATRDCSWDCGFFTACLSINDNGDPEPVLRTLPRYHPDEEVLTNGEAADK